MTLRLGMSFMCGVGIGIGIASLIIGGLWL